MRYRVLQPVEVPAGALLSLDEHQVARRRHAVREIAGGRLQALHALSFKRGECIEIHNVPPKRIAALLVAEPARQRAGGKQPEAAPCPSPKT